MMQSATRTASRRLVSSSSLRSASRRCLSTAPPAQKSRSWKSSAARWAIAVGGVYYYNTSTFFAEEPEASIRKLDTSIQQVQESDLPTVDAIVAEKRARQAQAAEQARKEAEAPQSADVEAVAQAQHETEVEGGIGGLEEEADQQGAFNPETGEINWDCPCLGGMAHGPCGDEFKEAFSCFVYSKEEPKGIECIEKFKGMQDCFRQHPDMYGAELEDDEDEVEEELRAREVAKVAGGPSNPEPSAESTPSPKPSIKSQESDKGKEQPTVAKEASREGKVDAPAAQDIPGAKATSPAPATPEGDMPKAAYDATASNEGK